MAHGQCRPEPEDGEEKPAEDESESEEPLEPLSHWSHWSQRNFGFWFGFFFDGPRMAHLKKDFGINP